MSLHNEADEETSSYLESMFMLITALPTGIAYKINHVAGIIVGALMLIVIVALWIRFSFRSYPDLPRQESPTC